MNDDSSTMSGQGKLSSADAAELAAGVAELTKAGLPLPAGLRALAGEVSSRRLRDQLHEMADRLERGDSIETVMASASRRLPPHLYGLLLAGLRSGRLPEVMEEYLQMETSQRELRQRLRLSLAYPIFLVIFMTVMVMLFNQCILASFEKIFKDFGTALPTITTAFFASSQYLQWIMVGLVAVMFCIPLLASDAPVFRWLAPVVYRTPLLGTLLKYSRWAVFSKMTAILLAQKVPLSETLRLVAGGLFDPYLSRACRRAAADVDRGSRLSDAMLNQSWFPPSIIPFVQWGETEAALPEAFSSAHKLYDSRANSQTTSFMAILVPVMFLVIVLFAAITVIAIFMPLISLITSLTGGGVSRKGEIGAMEAGSPIFFVMLGILSLGVLILAVRMVFFWRRNSLGRHPIERTMTVAGWGLVYGATACILFAYVNILLGLLWLCSFPCIVVFIGFHGLRSKQQGLLWMLALAAEKNIRLEPAIEAYAYETGGSFGGNVAELSMMLKSGVPLPEALRMVPRLIPADRYPLVCSAYESGALAKGLREAAVDRYSSRLLWGSLLGKLLYIMGVVMFGLGILTFLMVKIIPAFEKIFMDFGTQLPTVTTGLITASRFLTQYWYVIFPIPFMLLVFAIFYTLLRFLGLTTAELPGLERLTRRKHVADIMDSLAVAIENRRTLASGLQTLARRYSQGNIRWKLAVVLSEVEAGASWLDSLYRVGLMRKSDLAVLQAAQRAGNLPWAMREMADSNRRRLVDRLNVFMQLIFPPVVLCLGVAVMFVVVAIFMPLILLIRSMT